MNTYIVNFIRYPDEDAEYVPPLATNLQHFDQLLREFAPSGIVPRLLSALRVDENRLLFTTALDHPGAWRDLHTALQEAYDADGVAGYFVIVATATNPEPVNA